MSSVIDQSALFVDQLLKKHKRSPSFPFHDWTENPVSFYALMNLWDEIFKTAAGQMASDYTAGSDVKMEIESLIYDVRRKDRTRRVAVYPEKEGGTFGILTSFGDPEHDAARDDGTYWPDRTELSLPIDLNEQRLCAAFKMIHRYVRADLSTFDKAADLNAAYVRDYRNIFGFLDFDPFEHYDESGRYVEPPDDEEED